MGAAPHSRDQSNVAAGVGNEGLGVLALGCGSAAAAACHTSSKSADAFATSAVRLAVVAKATTGSTSLPFAGYEDLRRWGGSK